MSEALQNLRANPPVGRVVYFYVTDADDKLIGVVPTRRLLLSQPEARIEDVMIRQVVAIPMTATVLDACEFFTMHRFLAFPVVDFERHFVGIIDVELYTDELAELAEHEPTPAEKLDEVFQLIGVHLSESAKGRPLQAAAGRFPWLLCNIAGGLAAAFLSGIYRDVLATWVALALFIPIVLALAESVAIQSVTLALEGLRTRRPSWRRLLRRGLAEGAVGLLLGFGSALVVAAVCGVWLQDWKLVGVLVGAIGAGVTAAALIGFSVPTLLYLFDRNPQVAAGPVSLASADLITLVLYFNLARLAI